LGKNVERGDNIYIQGVDLMMGTGQRKEGVARRKVGRFEER